MVPIELEVIQVGPLLSYGGGGGDPNWAPALRASIQWTFNRDVANQTAKLIGFSNRDVTWVTSLRGFSNLTYNRAQSADAKNDSCMRQGLLWELKVGDV